MLFFLSAAEYNNVQNNATKVRVHLNGGVAEVLDQHQDLMGRVENNIIEIETFFENRTEKLLFVLQDAVFVVSNKGLGLDKEKNQTSVYVYAKRAEEISSTGSSEAIAKQYEVLVKQIDVLKEKQLSDLLSIILKSKIALMEEEAKFLLKIIAVLKARK